MRQARGQVAPAEAAAERTPALEALERHRDHHFRRLSSRRISGERGALAFIEAVGFCTAFTPGLGVPCLREAIAGMRDPELPEHIQHDHAIAATWEIKDALAARRLVYYGKAIAGRPAFIAREMLSAFLRLRAEPGGYVALYREGRLSHAARLVMDALLSAGGPVATRELRLASGFAKASRRAGFDRAMQELQGNFLALKVEERYDPFTYVWDTMERRWADALAQSRRIPADEAAVRIVRRHFEIAAFAGERVLARLLGIDPAAVARAAAELAGEGLIVRGMRIAGMPGAFSVLAAYVR
jgi:hypothetical protein